MLDCSPAARRLGVRPGQPLGSAHKLAPEALFLAPDPPAYRAAAERGLDALAAFTPAVEGRSEPAEPGFGQVLLGIEGLERLWGEERQLVGRMAVALAPVLPGPPRAGIGGTRFGAEAAAAAGGEEVPLPGGECLSLGRIPPGGAESEAAWLAPLPIGRLPADTETLARCALFGLRRIGDLARLPRSAVVARFGAAGGELHDLARGLDGRRLVPRRPVERLEAAAELDPPVESLEPLRFVLHHLAGALCEQLAARGAGASRAILRLELEAAPPVVLEQAFPEPVALPDLVERLLVARLEAVPLGAPATRLSLELDGRAPAAGQQLGLFTPQSARAARLEWQLAGLAIRFGPGRLLRARLADPEAPLAESRVRWLPLPGEGRPA
ncbi:MAG TPA: hypothetical protein VFK38_03015 [Candidatus Limnocylindrales bacterium]|nr:hypothetical protein [Candidatus Limnocylindrales bacterium]